MCIRDSAKTVVLATGTYFKARCLHGEVVNYTGPNGLQAANYLSQSLKDNGVELYRFKTGTPARIDKRSVNFDVMEEQFGDCLLYTSILFVGPTTNVSNVYLGFKLPIYSAGTLTFFGSDFGAAELESVKRILNCFPAVSYTHLVHISDGKSFPHGKYLLQAMWTVH